MSTDDRLDGARRLEPDMVYVCEEAAELHTKCHKFGTMIAPRRLESAPSDVGMIWCRQTQNAKLVELVVADALKRYHVARGRYLCDVKHTIRVATIACAVLDTLASAPDSISSKELLAKVTDAMQAVLGDRGPPVARADGAKMARLDRKRPRTFAVTLRPSGVDFATFYDQVRALLKRRCFVEYNLVFRQEGLDDEGLGSQFHAHIVAEMTQTSKFEVIRDLSSTAARFGWNAVHAERHAGGADARSALLEDADRRWRERVGIAPAYASSPTSMPPLSL